MIVGSGDVRSRVSRWGGDPALRSQLDRPLGNTFKFSALHLLHVCAIRAWLRTTSHQSQTFSFEFVPIPRP